MSTELPWCTNVFMMVNFLMSTNITMGSSCEGLTPLNSSSVKVIGGILGWNDIAFPWCTILRCFFLALLELPPLVNPLAIVLMTSRSPLISFPLGGSPLLGRSSLLGRRSGRRSFSYTLDGCSLFFLLVLPFVGTALPLAPLHDTILMPDLGKFLNLIL